MAASQLSALTTSSEPPRPATVPARVANPTAATTLVMGPAMAMRNAIFGVGGDGLLERAGTRADLDSVMLRRLNRK